MFAKSRLVILLHVIMLTTTTPMFAQSHINQPVYPKAQESKIVSLNGSWKFKYIKGDHIPVEDKDFYQLGFIKKGKGWGKIDVPSNWELQGKAEPSYGEVKEGIGLYRTKFSIPSKFRKKTVFIRLGGVLYAYKLYINGKYVGKWQSAFNGHMFNITPFIHRDKPNILAIKVMTHTDRGTYKFDESDGWALSGIFRDVTLFSVPNNHFDNIVFQSSVHPDRSVKINIKINIGAFKGIKHTPLNLSGTLTNPNSGQVYSFKRSLTPKGAKSDSIDVEKELENPLLWTAETPHLYNLKLTLSKNEKEIQTITRQVGLREIIVKNAVLMLNNRAIKLKGVNMHEINPERGRALNEDDIKKDLRLAKKANINFIRTSHYPHEQRFFELADSMGFYVDAEIPFNGGPSGFTQNLDYLPNLLTRAKATVNQNKNHPSIILWSLGNENDYGKIFKKLANFVALKDSTRPRLFPQSPHQFKREGRKKIPSILNVLAPHYQLPNQLKNLAENVKRPIITTEYAHSLGLSTENLQGDWQVIRKYPKLAGGAIWMWSDQGIKRKRSKKEFLADKTPIEGVWLDTTTYYDGDTVHGNDGLVYSDRHPQIDYWLARKIYSPIWIPNKEIVTNSGKQRLKINIENRFDFKSLKGFQCSWILNHYTKKIQQGKKKLNISPQKTGRIEIPVSIPDANPKEFTLKLNFFNPKDKSVYRTSVQIRTQKKQINYRKLIQAEQDDTTTVKVTQCEEGRDCTFISGKYLFSVNKDGLIHFKNRHTMDLLINGYPILRVGRKPTITLTYQGKRYKDKGRFDGNFFWDPYLLTHPKLLKTSIRSLPGGYELTASYRWDRQEKKGEYIEGNITFNIQSGGDVAVSYDLKPYHATGIFMEVGLGFKLPKKYSLFSWLGDGPFVSVPGKTIYNMRDIWTLNKNDIRFMGNRANTDLVAFHRSNKANKTGLGLRGNKSNFGVERVGDSIVFTRNALISGFGSKVNFSKYAVKADTIKSIQGEFDMLILGKNSKVFNEIFSPLPEPTVEKPYLKSYGF